MAEVKNNRTMTADGQLMFAVIDKKYPFLCYTIYNGKWTSEFPYFTGSLSQCQEWVVNNQSKHKYTQFMAVDYDSWVKGKAQYEAEKRDWQWCNDSWGD